MSVESLREAEPVCCEYCGLPIEEDEQRCPALEDGRCAP